MGYGIVSKPSERGHDHHFRGTTSLNFGHRHSYRGTTSVASGGVDRHTHKMIGVTDIADGHVHNYNITTGPGIAAEPGYHIHRYAGTTTANGRGPHVHCIRGYTSPAKND